MNTTVNSATSRKASNTIRSVKVLLTLLAFSLLSLLVSCNPSNVTVNDYYNIDGTFLLKFTVTESNFEGQPIDTIIESERTFVSNGNTVSTVEEDVSNQATGPRSGNVINFSRVNSANVKLDTTITMTSNDSMTGTTTALYEDGSKVIYSLVGTRKK